MSIFVFLKIKIVCHSVFSYDLAYRGESFLNTVLSPALTMTYCIYLSSS